MNQTQVKAFRSDAEACLVVLAY